MIQFKSVEFKNYLMFKECFIPLDNQGIVFVSGKNGTGKTAAFEAIQVPLFKYHSKGIKDNLLAPDGKNLEIKVCFLLQGNEYEIILYRAHTKYKNKLIVKKNGVIDADAPKNITPLEKYIKDLLKIQLTEYKHFIHTHQGAYNSLISGDPSERYNFIANLFNLSVYDTIYNHLDDLHKTLQSELSEVKRNEILLTQFKDQLLDFPCKKDLDYQLESHQNALKCGDVEKETLYKKLMDYKNKQSHTDNIIKCKKAYNKLKDLHDVTKTVFFQDFQLKTIPFGDIYLIENEIMRINRYISSQENIIHENIIYMQHLSNKERIEYELSELDDIVNINELYEKKQILLNEFHLYKDMYKDCKLYTEYNNKLKLYPSSLQNISYYLDTMTDINKGIALAKKEIDDNNIKSHNYATIENAALCTLCGAVLNSENTKKEIIRIKQKNEIATKELTELNKLLNEYKQHYDMSTDKQKIEDTIINLLKKWKKMKSLDEIKTIISNHEITLKRINDNINIATQVKFLKEELNKIPIINHNVKELLDIEKKCHENIKYLKNYKNILDENRHYFNILPTDYNNYNLTLNYAVEIPTIERDYKELCDDYIKVSKEYQKIVDIKNQLMLLKTKIKECNTLLKERKNLLSLDTIYTVLKKAYSKHLKALKIKQILETIQNTLPKYTDMFFKDKYFRVNPHENKINLITEQRIHPDKIIQYDIKKLSGGEICKLNLCLLLTFHDITTSDKRSNILILDEVDHFMDDDGSYCFYNEFLAIAKNKFDSIFIISHETELAYRTYDKKIIIQKDYTHSKLSYI